MTTKTMEGAPIERRGAWAAASLACMGVVFGDIGTSPLYTLQVATKAASPAERFPRRRWSVSCR